jgi:ribosome biogenesis GTPase
MARQPHRRRSKEGEKVRVPFRRNRAAPPRDKDWKQRGGESDDRAADSPSSENIVAKGDLSRRRTVIVHDDAADRPGVHQGVVVAMSGLYADVDDGARIWNCTIRRILRTRLITGRHPVAVGDHVRFTVEGENEGVAQEGVAKEGVIESVDPRTGQLCRRVGRRIQTIVANVDQAIIVSSAAEPPPKTNLIDRYIVSSLAGSMTPVICMNKIDLDVNGYAAALLDRYAHLGYRTLRTSVSDGRGIDDLRDVLRNKESVVAGQSGVGKSSLLNALQPGLALRIGAMIEKFDKGRHTTTTASLLRLDFGGYVVDTPGIRSFDVSDVPRQQLEVYFVEFVPLLPDCKFPDCSHTHETDCRVKDAVGRGEIHPDRYDSYVRLFTDQGE